jgi:polysaccharide biosynthesis protein PslG
MPADDPALLRAAGLPMAPPMPTAAEIDRARGARRRTLLRLGLLLMVVLLVVEFVYLGPFFDAGVGATLRVPDPVPLAEVQPYGVNVFLHKEVDVWKKNLTLSKAQELGVGWIKQQFPWAEIEYRVDPQRPYWDVKNNQNAWTKFDNIVSLAKQYGLRVIARIDSTPAWAHPDNPDAKAPPSPDHMDDFGNFISEFVKRYRGTVAAIQVWNEPNLRDEWGGKRVNAAEYANLLKVAYDSAKSANPDIIVLAAPLATNNERLAYNGNLNEIDYLQGMYDAGAEQYFDAMAANAYGTWYAPEDEPSREKLNFRRVELLHDVMVQNGDSDKSVWFNEYGWNASPADMPEVQLRWGRVTPEQQADYTVRGIEYAREHWPWAGVFTIWYLRQVGDIPRNKSEYYFGLMDQDFVTTRAFADVKNAVHTTEKVAMPGQWGPLSPPVQADPGWSIRLSPAMPGGMYVSPSAIGDTLTIPFVGNRVTLSLVPPASTGDAGEQTVAARYYVSIDGSSAHVAPDLPMDATGAAYIDVPAGGQVTNVVVADRINPELRTGKHVLEITVAAAPEASNRPAAGGRTYAPVVQRPDLPGIGIITVEVHRSYVLFALLTLALLAGIVFTLWALRRSRPLPEAAQAAR